MKDIKKKNKKDEFPDPPFGDDSPFDLEDVDAFNIGDLDEASDDALDENC